MRRKFTCDEFVSKSVEVHGTKYNYGKSNYSDIKTKLIIVCPIHGDFSQTPDSHLYGRGCPFCSGNARLTTKQFVDRCKEVHLTTYDYSRVNYKSGHSKVAIICPKHGEFWQIPKDHLKGIGCSKCKTSRGESKIIKFLDRIGISYKHQHWFSDCRSNIGKQQVLRFDFYIPSKNILIEFDGKQHFEVGRMGSHTQTENDLKYIKRHDQIKTNYARRKGIKLLRIKYTQLSKIDEILVKTLL